MHFLVISRLVHKFFHAPYHCYISWPFPFVYSHRWPSLMIEVSVVDLKVDLEYEVSNH
jgi:hypothetical protein